MENPSTIGWGKLVPFRPVVDSCLPRTPRRSGSVDPTGFPLTTAKIEGGENGFAGKESEVLANRNRAGLSWLVILTAVTSMPGCGAFGLRKQLQQLEHENSRLLSEFRAERQRREVAEQNAQQMEHRLAESEKLLARQMQEGAGGRLSSLPNQSLSPGLPGSFVNGSIGGTLNSAWDGTGGPNALGGPNAMGGQSRSGQGDLMWKQRSQ